MWLMLAQVGLPSIEILLAGGLVAVVGAFLLLINPRFALPLAGLMFVMSSLGPTKDKSGPIVRFVPTIITPLQIYRSEIMGVLGLALLFALLIKGKFAQRSFPVQAGVLVLIGLYGALLRTIHTSVFDAGLSVVLALVVVAGMAFALPRFFDSREDIVKLIRYTAFGAAGFAFAVAVQITVNQAPMLLGNRFTGFTANPNACAAFAAAVTAMAVWLALYDRNLLLRSFWIGLAAVFAIMVLWTGSRTGFAVMVIALGAVSYRRIGKLVFLAPPAALVGFFILRFVTSTEIGQEFSVERLGSLENTRATVWANMYRAGMQSPIIGVGVGEAEGSENSLLLGFSSYGLGMVLLLLLLYAVSFWVCWKAWRMRSQLIERYRPICDLVLAMNGVYLAASITEGIMISRMGPWLILIILTSCISSHLWMFKERTAEQYDYGYGDDYSPADTYDEDPADQPETDPELSMPEPTKPMREPAQPTIGWPGDRMQPDFGTMTG